MGEAMIIVRIRICEMTTFKSDVWGWVGKSVWRYHRGNFCNLELRKFKEIAAYKTCVIYAIISLNFLNLKTPVKTPGKHLEKESAFSKVAGLQPASSFKMKIQHWWFSASFNKFFKHIFYRTRPGDITFSSFIFDLLWCYSEGL